MAFHLSRFGFGFVFVLRFAVVFALSEGAALEAPETRNADAQIATAQMYAELSRAPSEFLYHHLALMFTIAGYGDRLYNAAQRVSGECSLTAVAAMSLLEQLNVMVEMGGAVRKAVNESIADVRAAAPKKPHPVEFICRRLEKLLTQDANLGAAFDEAKEAAEHRAGAGRPPYFDRIIDSLESLHAAVDKIMAFPEFARLIASAIFRFQLTQANRLSPLRRRRQLFVECVVLVAKKSEFRGPMQSVYERTLNEIVPQIVQNAKNGFSRTFWFLPTMLRTLNEYIAENSTLKREMEKAAVIVGKDYDGSVNSDFSKM